MGPCLILASEKQAYILTDRGTFLAFRDRIDLEILVEGDASLRNPYGAILVNPARNPSVRRIGSSRGMTLNRWSFPRKRESCSSKLVGGSPLARG